MIKKPVLALLKRCLSEDRYVCMRKAYFNGIWDLKIFIRRQIRAPLFWWFLCPVCGCHVKKFTPYHNPAAVSQKYNISAGKDIAHQDCPVCKSNPRARMLWLYFVEKGILANLRSKTVLHLAPEFILYARLSRHVRSYHAADKGVDSYFYDFVRKLEDEDITALTYKDQSFDVVICNHVLEHIQDDGKAMAEIFRVLKRGGTAYLMIPVGMGIAQTVEDSSITTPEARTEAFGQWDHVRVYTRADFIKRLEKVGFKVTPSRPNLSDQERLRFGCDDRDEEIFVCEKI